MSDYTPIACAQYDIYEIAIMRGQRLNLQWRDPDGMSHEQTLTPKDLRIINQAEHLIVVDDQGREQALRLDLIHAARPETE